MAADGVGQATGGAPCSVGCPVERERARVVCLTGGVLPLLLSRLSTRPFCHFDGGLTSVEYEGASCLRFGCWPILAGVDNVQLWFHALMEDAEYVHTAPVVWQNSRVVINAVRCRPQSS